MRKTLVMLGTGEIKLDNVIQSWEKLGKKSLEKLWAGLGVWGIVGGIVGGYGFGVILWKRDPLT